MRSHARTFKHYLLNLLDRNRKSGAELAFWKSELTKYEQWYLGATPLLYWSPSPKDEEKVLRPNLREASVMTWHKLHQERKYLSDLALDRDAFTDKTVLDVGSGPIPSATCFAGAKIFCLDPLHSQYVEAGFPFDCYQNVTFIAGASEKMPLQNAQFDAVIAVNSIDHVNDIRKTAREIKRVLKPGGWLRMHVHYHGATITEPVHLNDKRMTSLFSWCPNFHKISESSKNWGICLPLDEKFALWGNF